MNVTITPNRTLSGEIEAPPSKAHTHRALFAGLLSEGVTEIISPLSCDDTRATVRSITALGAKLVEQPGIWSVAGNGGPKAPADVIDCGESGVTLRFTIPIAALTGGGVTLRIGGGLARRPLEPLTNAMRQLGIKTAMERDVVRVEAGPPPGGGCQHTWKCKLPVHFRITSRRAPHGKRIEPKAQLCARIKQLRFVDHSDHETSRGHR